MKWDEILIWLPQSPYTEKETTERSDIKIYLNATIVQSASSTPANGVLKLRIMSLDIRDLFFLYALPCVRPLPPSRKWFSEQSWNWKSNKSTFHWQLLAEDWSFWLRYSSESQSLQVEWMATESLRQCHADRETILALSRESWLSETRCGRVH